MPLAILPVVARITTWPPEVGHRRLGLPTVAQRSPFYHEHRRSVWPGFAAWRCGLRLDRPGTVPRDRVDYITAVARIMEGADAPECCSDALWRRAELCRCFVCHQRLCFSGSGRSRRTDQFQPDRHDSVKPGNLRRKRDLSGSPDNHLHAGHGRQVAKSLLRPIPPSAIFELIQAGYPADYILQMTTRAINGVYNRSSMAGGGREADPEFYPLLDALRRLQNSGAVSLRLEKHGSDETGILILAGRRAAEVDSDLQFVRKTLGVIPEKNGEVTLTFGALPRSGKRLPDCHARCWEILLEVANGIDVPNAHVAEGRTAHFHANGQCAGPARSSADPRSIGRNPARQSVCSRALRRYVVLDPR